MVILTIQVWILFRPLYLNATRLGMFHYRPWSVEVCFMNSFHLILIVAIETAPAASNSNASLIIGCSLAGAVIFTAAIVFGLLFSSALKFYCLSFVFQLSGVFGSEGMR